MIKRIDEYKSIPLDERKKLWNEIKEKHKLNLARFDVRLPGEDTAKYYQLIYLYKYMNCLVHKDVVADYVQENRSDLNNDQQVRHLAADGFSVLNRNEQITNTIEKVPSGYNILTTLDFPKAIFMAKAMKRMSILSAQDFDSVKKAFDYCCATCGAKEGEPHKVSGVIVQLQQGHMDPNQELKIGNIIPQCQYCNQNIFKDYFEFDENGYPKKIAKAEYVLKSDKPVRRMMYELIKKKDNIKE